MNRGRALVAYLIGAGLFASACEERARIERDVASMKFGALTFSPTACEPNCSSWVYPAHNGTDLIYAPDHDGDRIADFSHVGYKRGAAGLPSDSTPPQTQPNFPDDALPIGGVNWGPTAPPPATLLPQHLLVPICGNIAIYNHGPKIQELLDQVGARTPDPVTGVRGRVWLPRAHFAIWSRLVIPDGVLLRGWSEHSGPSGDATTLHACEPVNTLITIGENGSLGSLGSSRAILDDNVPSGANSIRVAAGHNLAAGDHIQIRRTPCSSAGAAVQTDCPKLWQWTLDIGMNANWEPEQIVFERFVTSIQPADNKNGATTDSLIFFDPPITSALEGKYGPHTVRKYGTAPDRTRNAGVFRLRAVGERSYANCGSSCAGQSMIGVHHVEDVWISEIVGDQFTLSVVRLHEGARWTTVDVAESINTMGPSVSDAGQWRYPFFNMGSMNLVIHTTAIHPRHTYLVHKWMAGPNAFVDGSADYTHQDSGAHLNWSTGALFDNIRINSSVTAVDPNHTHITDGELNVENRGVQSSPFQGWAGSSIVVWNSHAAKGFSYFNPIVNAASYTIGTPAPAGSGQNWLIGATVDPGQAVVHTPSASLLETVPHMDFYATTAPNAQTGLLAGILGGNSLYRTSAHFYRHENVGPPGSLTAPGFEVRTYVVGDSDDFVLEDGSTLPEDVVNDSVYVNPAFKSWIATTPAPDSFRGFDYYASGSSEKSIPFSIRYDLAPADHVRHAYLAVRIKRAGSWIKDSDHLMQFAGAGTTATAVGAGAVTYYWRNSDGTLPNGAEVLPLPLAGPIGWSTLTSGGSVRVLELNNQVFDTILNRRVTSGGRTWGELNVNFAKKTRLDWAMLTLVIDR
jgi:hypothetical protein